MVLQRLRLRLERRLAAIQKNAAMIMAVEVMGLRLANEEIQH